MFLHLDCRYYRGDRPCKFHRLCEGCPHYEPMGPRVLIIKLGALGDVVRTHALIPGLARMFGEAPWVVWLTSPAAVDLVKRMPGVSEVMPFNAGSISALREQHFDAVICLDKEPEPCSVAMAVPARSRLGVGLSRYGTPFPLNDEADYYFRLGLDNDEKFFRNRKSYQQLMYEALGLDYRGEAYTLDVTDADRAAADAVFNGLDLREKKRAWVGINPGAGKVFAYKAWREQGYVELIRALADRRPDVGCLLLGGADETDLIERIRAAAATPNVFSAGTNHSLGAFTAVIDRCDALVCGDTLAMHLGIARGLRVVPIFGPTCEQEIDLFGRGEKIVTPIGCAPCYKRHCDFNPTCQDEIPTSRVLEAVERQLDALDREREETSPPRAAAAKDSNPAHPPAAAAGFNEASAPEPAAPAAEQTRTAPDGS